MPARAPADLQQFVTEQAIDAELNQSVEGFKWLAALVECPMKCECGFTNRGTDCPHRSGVNASDRIECAEYHAARTESDKLTRFPDHYVDFHCAIDKITTANPDHRIDRHGRLGRDLAEQCR